MRIGWPAADPALLGLPAQREIHLWAIDLRLPLSWASLNEQELAHAQRYHLELHRRRFLNSRANLRYLLARYLKLVPGILKFETGRHGRPALPGTPFDFNFSHSEDLALLAVSPHRVGIDVEHRKEGLLEAMSKACHPSEQAFILRQIDPDLTFLRCWTRKEACLKADGRGLSLSPSDLIVVDTPTSTWMPRIALEKNCWHVQDLSLGPDSAGALACANAAHIRPYRLERY